MNPLSDDPRYVNMRAGIVTCLARVGDAVGTGAMASEMLRTFCRPVVDQLDVDDVMFAHGVEGSLDYLSDGWRLAMCQLAKLIDRGGDFELLPGRINRTWSALCVDALRNTQQPQAASETRELPFNDEVMKVTTYEERTEFGPAATVSYVAFIAEYDLGDVVIRISVSVGRTREEAVKRLMEAVERAITDGQTADLEYAHVVLA